MCAKRTTHRFNAVAKHCQMSSKFTCFHAGRADRFFSPSPYPLTGTLHAEHICTMRLTRMDCNSSGLGDQPLRGQSIRVEAEVA